MVHRYLITKTTLVLAESTTKEYILCYIVSMAGEVWLMSVTVPTVSAGPYNACIPKQRLELRDSASRPENNNNNNSSKCLILDCQGKMWGLGNPLFGPVQP